MIITLRNSLICLLLLVSTASFADRKKKVEFVGGARSIMDNSSITARDTMPDTTALQKQTGGYALVDVGLEIRPNSQTEIMGMFRIRNDFGGFWGAGVTFDVRQLWLKGVLGNALKYQVGDLNLKQTPFTLYNHHADRIDSLPEIFQLQNNIINYENFYSPDNTWRTQGAAIDFGLSFSKGIKELDFNIYTTRIRATDFASVPDRIMPGGSVDMWILDELSIGYNINATTDVPGTVNDTADQYRNTVQSIDMHYARDFEKVNFALDAEIGTAKSNYMEAAGGEILADGFAHMNFTVGVPKWNSEFQFGFLNVAPEFRSIGAQSKDVNYEGRSSFYPTFTSAKIARPISLMDMVGDLDIYQRTVNSQLMPMNPVYNNITPYGLATFNRTGFLFNYTYKPKFLQLDFQNKRLREVIGQGTTQLRQFNSAQLLTKLYIHELASMSKKMNLSMGFRLDNTWREGLSSLEDVSLDNTWITAGMDWEFFENIDFLAGIIMQNTIGNEFITERDSYTRPEFYTRAEYDLQQNFYSLGLRYRFTEQVQLSAIYQNQSYENALVDMPDYDLSNFMLLFNMTF